MPDNRAALVDPERCSNCGRAIGPLETACLWQDQVVCFECRKRLDENALALEEPLPPPAPPGDHRGIGRRIWIYRTHLFLSVLVLIGIIGVIRQMFLTQPETPKETPLAVVKRVAETHGLYPRIETSLDTIRGRQLTAIRFTSDVTLPREIDLVAYQDVDGRVVGFLMSWTVNIDPFVPGRPIQFKKLSSGDYAARRHNQVVLADAAMRDFIGHVQSVDVLFAGSQWQKQSSGRMENCFTELTQWNLEFLRTVPARGDDTIVMTFMARQKPW